MSCPLLASANPQACRSMCGWLEAEPRLDASPLHHPGEPSRGERTSPLRLVNTNGDLGSCSRCKRTQGPQFITHGSGGWLGVPCLTLRTCQGGSWRSRSGPTAGPPVRTPASHAATPRFTKPQLATLKSKAPNGDQWLHEIKYLAIGSRSMPTEGNTRNGLDWTTRLDRFRYRLSGEAIIDGEVVVVHEGWTNFSELQAE